MLASLACLCYPYLVGCCTHSCALWLEYPPGQLQKRLTGTQWASAHPQALPGTSRLSAGRGKAASSVITAPLRAIFPWPETIHSFSGFLLIVHLLHCPWFTFTVAQPSLLCEQILGRRIKNQKPLLGFVCFWYLDRTLSQLAKSIKAHRNCGVLFKRIKYHRKVNLVGLYPSPAFRWVQKDAPESCISVWLFSCFEGKVWSLSIFILSLMQSCCWAHQMQFALCKQTCLPLLLKCWFNDITSDYKIKEMKMLKDNTFILFFE